MEDRQGGGHVDRAVQPLPSFRSHSPDRSIDGGCPQRDQADGRGGRYDQGESRRHFLGDERKVPKPQGEINDDMRQRIGERRHPDHASHDNERPPAEYGRRRRNRQRCKQDRGCPKARPVSHAAERNRSELPAGNLIDQPDRRHEHEGECAGLQHGKLACPVLPRPDQLHVSLLGGD